MGSTASMLIQSKCNVVLSCDRSRIDNELSDIGSNFLYYSTVYWIGN